MKFGTLIQNVTWYRKQNMRPNFCPTPVCISHYNTLLSELSLRGAKGGVIIEVTCFKTFNHYELLREEALSYVPELCESIKCSLLIIARHSKSIKRLEPLWRQKSLSARPVQTVPMAPNDRNNVIRPIGWL